MIINIQGCSGSGKSTIAYAFLKKFPVVDEIRVKGKVEAYRIVTRWGDLFIIGRYETDCGGCDTISSQDEVCRLVRKYAKKGHVIFEGLIVSYCYGRYSSLLRKLGPENVMVFLDTPLKVCISRVKRRRKRKGNTKPFNTTGTEAKWHGSKRYIERAIKEGNNFYVAEYRNAYEEVLWLLKHYVSSQRRKANTKQSSKSRGRVST